MDKFLGMLFPLTYIVFLVLERNFSSTSAGASKTLATQGICVFPGWWGIRQLATATLARLGYRTSVDQSGRLGHSRRGLGRNSI